MPKKELDKNLEPILESLLCASGEPLAVEKAVEAIGGVTRAQVVGALKELQMGYERDGRGFRLREVAGGYQLRTAPEHSDEVRRLLRAEIRCRRVVAYRQKCRVFSSSVGGLSSVVGGLSSVRRCSTTCSTYQGSVPRQPMVKVCRISGSSA